MKHLLIIALVLVGSVSYGQKGEDSLSNIFASPKSQLIRSDTTNGVVQYIENYKLITAAAWLVRNQYGYYAKGEKAPDGAWWPTRTDTYIYDISDIPKKGMKVLDLTKFYSWIERKQFQEF